jgi:6-phosphogluconolactonase
MSATIFRFCSVLSVLLVLSFLAGCGGGHSVFCAAPATGSTCTCGPCPVNPGPEFVYATNNSTEGQILTFTVDHKTGALGTPTATAGPAMAQGITSAQHQFLYVSDTQNNGVDAFSINQTTGALTTIPGSPFSPGGVIPFFPLGLVAGADLYATSVSGGITGFTIASNGALSPVVGSPFSGGVGGQAALGQSNTTPINYFLYATNFIDPNGAISAFKVDPASGILTPIPGNFTTGALSGPDGIVFDGTLGPFVFVALNTANKIAAFSVDPTTGALTPVPGSPFAAGFEPVFLALSASQNFLYAMNFLDRSISAYSIASNGMLTQVSGSPFLLSDTPGDITVTGDNFLYVTLPKSNQILGFSIAANGGLSALAGSPFTASGPVLLTTVQIPPP